MGLIAVIVGATMYGYGKYDNSRTFVSTGDAQVVADLVQVGSSNAGRIISVNVEEGDPILEGQLIATVDIATVISRSDTTDTVKIGFETCRTAGRSISTQVGSHSRALGQGRRHLTCRRTHCYLDGPAGDLDYG